MNLSEFFSMEKCHRKKITFRQSGGKNYRKEKKMFYEFNMEVQVRKN